MATTFKTFLNNDVTTTKTLLHEAIPITGAIVSGTYDSGKLDDDASYTLSEHNIKTYSHGMFQSVFDYPHLSSSANHIFDISVGYSTGSSLSGNVYGNPGRRVYGTNGAATGFKQQEKKIAMYNQMAQVLMGHDKDGKIQRFDRDGNLSDDNDGKMDEVVFLNFSRLLVKDEIKKGSFQLKLDVLPSASHDLFTRDSIVTTLTDRLLTIKDTNAQNDFRINSPAGEYGILSASYAGTQGMDNCPVKATGHTAGAVGLIFYQAGVVVLTGSIFLSKKKNGIDKDEGLSYTSSSHKNGVLHTSVSMSLGGPLGRLGDSVGTGDGAGGVKGSVHSDFIQMLTGSSIDNIAWNIRNRIYDISFNNTTELNSTVYFCRANHNEFNYSANPTYLSSSKIRVKEVPSDMPVSYVTSVGLYSPDNELMAVAKLSEPLRKDPTNELTLRVRLDY